MPAPALAFAQPESAPRTVVSVTRAAYRRGIPATRPPSDLNRQVNLEDPAQVAGIYADLRPLAAATAGRMGVDAADFEDAYNAAWIEVLKRRTYNPDRPFKPWFFVLFVRTVLKRRRVQRPSPQVVAVVQDVERDPFLERELRRALWSPPMTGQRRAIFMLRELAWIPPPDARALEASDASVRAVIGAWSEPAPPSFRDIAELLGKTAGSCKVEYFRARGILRAQLERR